MTAAGFCRTRDVRCVSLRMRDGTYGLLGLDIVGVGGHWVRGLDLLLDDGRHLEAVTVSTHIAHRKWSPRPYIFG
jgi:hypothetical protein